MKDVKAVVTGSRGFIGMNLVKELVKRDILVYGLTQDETADYNLLKKDIDAIKPDYIFNLGAYGNHSSQTEPEKIVMANYVRLFFLLQATKDLDYKAFINFGSSSEYGVKDKPMIESMTCDPETFYGATKLGGTYLSKAYAKTYNKPIITVRPASVFGEGELDTRFMPQIVKHLLDRKPMDVVLEPKHSWVYIEDFVSAVMYLTNNVSKFKGGDIFNISYGKQWSNKQVIREFESVSGLKLPANQLNEAMRKYDNKNWLVSNNKLLNAGWKYKIGFSAGITNTYRYYRSLFDSYAKPTPEKKDN